MPGGAWGNSRLSPWARWWHDTPAGRGRLHQRAVCESNCNNKPGWDRRPPSIHQISGGDRDRLLEVAPSLPPTGDDQPKLLLRPPSRGEEEKGARTSTIALAWECGVDQCNQDPVSSFKDPKSTYDLGGVTSRSNQRALGVQVDMGGYWSGAVQKVGAEVEVAARATRQMPSVGPPVWPPVGGWQGNVVVHGRGCCTE